MDQLLAHYTPRVPGPALLTRLVSRLAGCEPHFGCHPVMSACAAVAIWFWCPVLTWIRNAFLCHLVSFLPIRPWPCRAAPYPEPCLTLPGYDCRTGASPSLLRRQARGTAMLRSLPMSRFVRPCLVLGVTSALRRGLCSCGAGCRLGELCCSRQTGVTEMGFKI